MEAPAVDARMHPQLHGARGGARASDRTENRRMPKHARAAPDRVVGPVVQEEQRVAAELE